MNTNYSNIGEKYKAPTRYLNDVFFPNGEGSIQEHLFENGLKFCKERPKFYTECEAFWSFYIGGFYDRMHYIIASNVTIKNKNEKLVFLFKNYNSIVELTDEVRGDIFIEYQTKIDQIMKPKSKTTQVGVKNKKVHLKQI